MSKPVFTAACCSNKGKIRANNEDNFFFHHTYLMPENREQPFYAEYCSQDELQLFGVFDGMGGESYGEEASLIAASLLEETFVKVKKNPNDIEPIVRDYLVRANEEICYVMRQESMRMGTTVALILLHEQFAYVCNVGDSRIYRLRNQDLLQLSVDHTEQETMRRLGVVAPVKISNRLTQHLGIFKDELLVEPNFIRVGLSRGDRFLLCSDGLTNMVKEDVIVEILSKPISAREIANQLITEALHSGGRDNITVIVAWSV
jgi:protein phosphatase